MENIIKCAMCFVTCASNTDLINHIVRRHRFDTQFSVQCKHLGCEVTFTNWKTFRQYIWRNHRHDHIGNGNDNIFIDAHDNVDDITEDFAAVEVNNVENDAECTWSTIEKMQYNAAKYVLNMRDKCKMSQKAVEHLIECTKHYIETGISLILDELLQVTDQLCNTVDFETVKNFLTDTYSLSSIFKKMDTQKKLDKILVKEFNMILPQEIFLYDELIWKSNREGIIDLKKVNRNAYIVPFLKSLKNLLSNYEVRTHINSQVNYNDNLYRTVLDGIVYHESIFFKNNPKSLGIIFYNHDLGITNPLSVSSRDQKISVFYWSLANIDPRFRCSQNAIQLYAIAKTSWLKTCDGLSKILEPFIKDIKSLQTDGLDIDMGDGRIKNYKGSLLFCAGDTPAAAYLGGFKESTAAYRPCRQYMITREDIHSVRSVQNFIIRNRDMHDYHSNAINNRNADNRNLTFWKRRYGINYRSPLLDIPNYDVTVGLPQDIMHVLIEGVVAVACKNFLAFLINDRQLFTLEELNNWRLNFHYYGHLRNDMPAIILEGHLDQDKILRQNASQMLVLAHVIPFIIADATIDNIDIDVNGRLFLHITLLKILNICLSYEIREETVTLLDGMIELYVRTFQQLYPNTVIPKSHFLYHIPQCIRWYGPVRQQWCYRFESAHAYFKGLVPILRNFKNMAYTLTYRHQSNLCAAFAPDPITNSKKVLYLGHTISRGITKLLKDLPNCHLFHRFIAEADREICMLLQTTSVKIYGCTYKINSIILLECEDDSLPQFGEINEIFLIKEEIFFTFSYLLSTYFHPKLNAYHVEHFPENIQGIIKHEELIFPHPLIHVKIHNEEFIALLNHERVET